MLLTPNGQPLAASGFKSGDTFEFMIGPHFEATDVALWINAMGSRETFVDGVTDYIVYHGFKLYDWMDVSKDMTFTIRGRPENSDIVASTNDKWYGRWYAHTIGAPGSGSNINNPTSYGVQDGADFAGATSQQFTIAPTTRYHPFELTGTMLGGNFTAGHWVAITCYREGGSGSDTLGNDMGCGGMGGLLVAGTVK